MSSFNQSRGFSSPSFTRSESSSSGWGVSEGWSTSPHHQQNPPPLAPPPPPSSLFPHPQERELQDSPSRLDYSVIDGLQTGVQGYGASRHLNGHGGAGVDAGEREDEEPWQLKRWNRISIVLKQELEGFLLKHNIWVIVAENGTSVTRRYSDFVWLLDCLVRRYPFRLLPSLPPKRLQVSGHYLATDELFLERRRRGLERALTALTEHPVVKRDGLLQVFLTEQGDLALWRKHNPITLSEESLTSHSPTPSQLSRLPSTLDTSLSSLRQRISPLVESWTRIVSHADRLAHRRMNQGQEYAKIKEALEAAVGIERDGWRPKEVEAVEREVEGVGKVLSGVSETDEASGRRKLDGVVEEFKRHREIYVNLRDLFHRQTTLGVDNVDKLKKRCEGYLNKLKTLQSASPRPANFSTETERLASLVEADQKEVERLLRRREFIRWCVWEEVQCAFRCTSLLSLALRDYASEETLYARRLVDQWSALGDALGAAE
ncbi:hypothetical protein JCM11251_007317 [Rhodosporidiobolus azoricus]